MQDQASCVVYGRGAEMRPPRYDWGPPVQFYPSRKPEALLELALANGFFRGGTASGERPLNATTPQAVEDRWKDDPPLVREFVFLARAEGFRPTSVEGGRQVVLRYARFLADHLGITREEAGWREYAAYKIWLAQSGIAKTSARIYLFYLQIFYRLRAQTYQDSEVLETYMRIRALCAMPQRGSTRQISRTGWRETMNRWRNLSSSPL